MLYAHVKDGSIVEVTGKPRWFNDDAQQLSDQELLSLGVFPVEDVVPPFDPTTHHIVRNPQDSWVIGMDKVSITYNTTAYTPAEVKMNLLRYAADARFGKETSGLVVSGQHIDTSRESQNMISGAYNYANENPDKQIKFKTASGWVSLDATTMIAIALAVGDHVQACFALEESIAAQIETGAITTTAQIDAAFAGEFQT